MAVRCGAGGSRGERARTILRLAPVLVVQAGTVVDWVDVHGADGEGDPLLLVSADAPLAAAVRAAGTVPASAEAVDLCPVPLADRIRGRLRLTGRLGETSTAGPEWSGQPWSGQPWSGRPWSGRPWSGRPWSGRPWSGRPGSAAGGSVPGPAGDRVLLRLRVAAALLDASGSGRGGPAAVPVDLDEYATARPDPLADGEADFLGHLLADHPAELAALSALIHPLVRSGADRVLPVRLDRHGLVLRVGRSGAATDVRLAFSTPLSCPRALPAAMRELLARSHDAAGRAR